MKNLLLATCAAIVLSLGASAASAEDRQYDNGYYGNFGPSWQFQHRDDSSYHHNSWDSSRYQNRRDAVSPRSIVRGLERNHYRNITWPVLSGQTYQVRAVNSNGHRVRLYIDRDSGRILRVKG